MSKISRRNFIQQLGLAATVGVPFLNSRVAMGQTTTAPLRVLFVPLQHGWGVDKEIDTFTGTATNFNFPRILRFLNPIKNECTVVDGVRTIYWGNAHDVAYSDILTCGVRFEEPASDSLGGPFMRPRNASLDWVIGNHHSKNVLRFSHNYTSFGAQHHPLSWDSNLNSLAYHTNSRSAWTSIIQPLQNGNNPVPVNNVDKNALFDVIKGDADRLLNQVTGSERRKLESYLHALNDLGNRILGVTPTTPISSLPLPSQPPNGSQSFNDQMDQYLAMIRIAFAYDTHRAGVLGLGEGANWTWTHPVNNTTQNNNTLGADFHQDVAHYDKGPNYTPAPVNHAAMDGWTQWYGQKIVSFVNSLASVQDVDGNRLLDNTLIVLTGEVQNGRHEQRDIPYILIGGGNRLSRGRWIQTPKVEPRDRRGVFLGSLNTSNVLVENGVNYGGPYSRHHAADLMVSIARLAGVPLNTFGLAPYNYQPIRLLY